VLLKRNVATLVVPMALYGRRNYRRGFYLPVCSPASTRGVIPSSDQVQRSDSLEVGEVLSGINVPELYTGVSCTGTVIQGDDVFRFSENFPF
jgi:hypothetical protein